MGEEIDIFNICHIKTLNDARAELEVSLMLTEALFSDDIEKAQEFNNVINIVRMNMGKMPIFTIIQLSIALKLLIYGQDSGINIFNIFNPEFAIGN